MADEGTFGNRLIIILFAAGIVALGSDALLKRHGDAKGWFDGKGAGDLLAELQADPSGRAAQGVPVEEARKGGRARYDGWADSEKERTEEEEKGILDRLIHAVAP